MQSQITIPAEVASNVLKECGVHNGQWVALCEAAFSADVAVRTPRVSTMAEDQGWFDGTDGR